MPKNEWPAARTSLKSIPAISVQYAEDAKNQREAEALLEEIKDR